MKKILGKKVLQIVFSKVIILFLVIIIHTPLLMSQTYQARNYSVLDGLPNSKIWSLYQDSRGLLWIGTGASLCTYDGKKFQVLRTPQGETLDMIYSITEDAKGTMWFGSHTDGIFSYDGTSFERYTSDNGLLDNEIRVVYYSRKFDLIAATSKAGVNIIKKDTIITSPNWMGTIDTSKTFVSIADAKDFIYFTCIDNISPIRYYPATDNFISVNQGDVFSKGALGLYTTSRGDTVFSRYPIGLVIKSSEGVVNRPEIGQVFNMDEDRDGNLWMASWTTKNRELTSGIFRYDGEVFVNFKDEFGIIDKEIWTVLCDTVQDVIWVGTLNDGLYKVLKKEITTYDRHHFNLPLLHINDLFVDSKNTLWISDNHELIKWNNEGNISFVNKRKMIKVFQDYWQTGNRFAFCQIDSIHRALRSLEESKVSNFEKENPFEFLRIIEDSDHTIYFSNRFGIFSSKGTSIDYYCPEGSEGYIELIGSDTLILAGSAAVMLRTSFRDKSVNIIDPLTGSPPKTGVPSYFQYLTPEELPTKINKMNKQGERLWFLSWLDGLSLYENSDVINFNRNDTTLSNNLTDICFDQHGNVIVSSKQGEVYIGQVIDSRFQINYTLSNGKGLRGRTIDWMVMGEKNVLWVGTDYGLNGIDLAKLYAENQIITSFYGQMEGYLGQGSKKADMDQNGNLYISTEETLIKVNTRETQLLKKSLSPREIVLKAIKIEQDAIDEEQIMRLKDGYSSLNEVAEIRHFNKSFEFYFDVLNYVNPEMDEFRYTLIGYNDDGPYWSNSRIAKYTNLSPGNYTLQVEAINRNTSLSSPSLFIKFSVPRPFWNLWYFHILSWLVLAFLIVVFTKKRVDRKRLKQIQKVEIETKILRLEMQALQAQMNPHFVFNCLTGIQYYVLENQPEKVFSYLADFSKVIRSSLVYANHTHMPIEKEIEFLNSYLRLEQMRFEDKFEYTIKVSALGDMSSARIPSMMIQPFAENAIKHGFKELKRKGELLIEFEKWHNGSIKCTITDNGRGREEGSKNDFQVSLDDCMHSTDITAKRINLFNSADQAEKYKINYRNILKEGQNHGLQVEIILPLV